jgi:lactoylglutathione lyase
MTDAPAPLGTWVELHVPDFERVHDFYSALGFKVLWERPPEGKKGYLVAQLGANVLCFWCGNDSVYDQSHFRRFPRATPRGFGVEIVLAVDDIDELFLRVRDEQYVVQPLEQQPWCGIRDFRVVDPFGFYLRFTEPFDIRESRYAVD